MRFDSITQWNVLILGFLCLMPFMAGVPARADTYEASQGYDLYGHLVQSSVPEIGDMACAPTSAINSFAYLQNRFPAVYGGRLTSTPPAIGDVQRMAGLDYMNTGKETGTITSLGIWGRYLYIESRLSLQTEYSCQVATVNGQPLYGDKPDATPWPANRPLPRYLTNAAPSVPGGPSVPTWQFLYQNLRKGADLGIGITYIDPGGRPNGGHCLSVYGFSFDDAAKTGTISFVDPAGKSVVTYAIRQNSDGGFLSGYPYLTLEYGGRKAVIEYVIAEYPAPQAVTNEVETGTILVLGTDSPYGALTFRGGILYAADPQTAWSKAMTLETAERTIFDSATRELTLSGAISGTGGLHKMGSGTLFLRGINSYAGGTALSEGTVNIVRDENLGDPAGSLILKGGTLQAGADFSSARSIILEAVPGTTIGTPGHSGFDTGAYRMQLSGALAGPGFVNQTGRGSLTLTGNSPGYVGEYTLESGTLILDGTLGDPNNSMMNIGTAGTLKGSGTLAVRYIQSHGTVNPGNSVGTLTIEGAYDQKEDGRIEVEIASATRYDKLQAKGAYGAAGLKGAVRPLLVNGYRPPANAIFPGIITTEQGISYPEAAIENNTPVLSWEIRYSGNQVDLALTRDYTAPTWALNPNQRSVGAMLNGIADSAGGDLAAVLNALDSLPTRSAVADAYRQISPDKASALPALSLAGSMMQWRTLSNRLNGRRGLQGGFTQLAGGGPGSFDLSYSREQGLMLAYSGADWGSIVNRPPRKTADPGPWELYTDFEAIRGSQDGSASQTGYRFDIYGLTGGADYRWRDDLLLGAGSGYYHTRSSYDSAGGSAEIHSIPVFVYAAYAPGAFSATGALGYTLNLYDLKRNVSFGGVGRTADGSVNGHQLNAVLETGYDLDFAKARVTPSAALFYTRSRVDGFTETGAGALNLTVDPQTADSLQSGVGVRVSHPFRTGRGAWVLPQLSAFYHHEFANDSRGVDARLAQTGGIFVFQTDSPGRDFAVLGAGLALKWGNAVSVQASYTAELGRGSYTAHYLSAGLRWEF